MVTPAEFLLHSPRRLAVVVGAVLAVIVVPFIVFSDGDRADTPPSVGASTTPSVHNGTPPSTPVLIPRHEGSTAPPTTPTPAPASKRKPPAPQGEHSRPAASPVQQVATKYLATFLDPKLPTATWSARLGALSTTTHRGTLATIPRSAVPRVKLTRVTVTRLASSAAVATATLSDGMVLLVSVVLDVDGWKVARVVPQESGAAR